MNENELRQALAGHAASIHAHADVDRLAAGMVRTDRIRTARLMGAGCLATAALAFGALNLGSGESTAPLDVVDSPMPTLPLEPEVALPFVDESGSEEAPTTSAPSASTEIAVDPDTTPDHLVVDEPSTTTTVADVVTTTTAPPTTVPPPTTAAPTTTAPPTTTTTAAVAFTATARYQSCAEDPPYDEYSGTAAPGATVTVTSPYSAPAQVTADASGDWWIRVEFPSAPPNEHFDVSAGDGASSKVFDFVHTV